MASDALFNFALLEDCAPKMKNQFQVSKAKFYNPDTVVEKAMVGGYFLNTYIYTYTEPVFFISYQGLDH